MHLPITAAGAMTTPILPDASPKAAATRAIFSASTPSANRLTTIAAVMSARKAFNFIPMIMPKTMAIPTASTISGRSTLGEDLGCATVSCGAAAPTPPR